ncbi:hypothetical protein [Cytobacillus firmus]|uniref:hypothetical protein n=1 Tax=Cytobacillus firmus TaxID=1399 RepID=UPI002162F320|nr:hypothetical protein [Cytobacillus firmus]MCS0672450.1 hypothetical protein [Cytobacillus firmus]
MKEFNVCYTLDADIKFEKIKKETSFRKEDVLKELFKKVERYKYFIIKSENKNHIIRTSKIRYIRILDKNE